MSNSSIPSWGSSRNGLIGVLALNLSIAAAILFVRSIYFIEGHPMQDYLHQIYDNVILQNSLVADKPWTLFTYNWILVDYWSLFINMFWLFLFGNILLQTGANRHIFPIYFYTGIVGGLLYILSGTEAILVGQDMSVIALAFAAFAYAPKYQIFDKAFPKLTTIYFLILYIIFFGILHKNANLITKGIYLAVGLCGYGYVQLLQKNIDLGNWMHKSIQYLNQMFEPKNNG
jgi:membrane associated rhomboid family serine protease